MPISAEVQLERRRKLLAKTREMILDVGVEALNVRELADHCGVSVPTLYNQFGNKENLVHEAADEIFRWHFEQMSPPKNAQPLQKIFYISDTTSGLILQNTELGRLLVRNIHNRSGTFRIASNHYVDQLKAMQNLGQLTKSVSVEFIGWRLYNRIRSTSIEWAIGQIGDEDLAPLRRCEIALILLGLVEDSVHTKLKRILAKESKQFSLQ